MAVLHAINFIVCTALVLFSSVLRGNSAAIRILHLYSAEYDTGEAALSVEQRINSNINGSLPHAQANVTVTEVQDMRCDAQSSRRNFIRSMLQEPTPLAVLDGACPTVSESIAEISPIPQISYTPYSFEYFTTEQPLRFPNLFSFYPSQQHLGQYITALLQYFNWRQVSVVYQQDYSQIVNAVNFVVNASNITVVNSVSYVEDMSSMDLFDDEAHIYLIVANSIATRSILCKAGERGLVYPAYTFITPHWYREDWWLVESDPDCGVSDLTNVLNNTLSVELNPKQFCTDQSGNTSLSPLLVYAHEAALVLATVFSEPLTSLNITPMEFGQQLITSCGETSFVNRMRIADKMVIYQYRGGQGETESRAVATVNSRFEFTFVVNESVTTLWPDGVPPDGQPLNVITSRHLAVVIVFYIITLFGIAFAIACLAFNIIFRNRKVVRLSSPKLNYLIIAGALILYITLYLVVYPNNGSNPFAFEVICNIFYASGIGVSLCVGTIQGKMFRIFYIFRNPSPVKKKIKDWHIAAYVGVLVLIDIVTYTIIMGVQKIRPRPILVPNAEREPTKNELQVEVHYFVYTCAASSLAYNIVVLLLTFAHRYALDVVSVILAICSSRKIKVEAVNDAKYVLAIVFLHFINITIINVILLTLRRYPNVIATATSLSVLEPPTDILLLTFIPKMVSLFRDPSGEKIFSNISPQEHVKVTGRSSGGTNTDDSERHGASTTTEH